jgi:hypothetical protein
MWGVPRGGPPQSGLFPHPAFPVLGLSKAPTPTPLGLRHLPAKGVIGKYLEEKVRDVPLTEAKPQSPRLSAMRSQKW